MSVSVRLLLVDALNLIRRIHAAQGGADERERVERAREGSVQSLLRALRECRPTHAACVFEGQGTKWRKRAYPGYKEGRPSIPEDLERDLPAFRAAFGRLGVDSLSHAACEADDVIATLAAKAAARGAQVTILSTDKVFLQLLGPGVVVRDHFERQDLDREYVASRFGVLPEDLVDFWALTGHGTNGITGVPGVGPKSASRLIGAHGTLEGVLQAAGNMEGRLGDTLRQHAEDARLARRLMRLQDDLVLGVNLRDLRYAPGAGD